MRHVLLSLPVAPRPPRVGEAARSRALVAPACFPLGLTPGLIPARHAAVPLAAVAVAAHQDLRLAAGPRTPIRPSRPRGASCSAAGPRSRPTHVAPPAPVPTAPVALAVPKRWTNAVRRCNTSGALCSARWGAVAQATATSFGRRTRLDAQASIVLPLSGLLAQDPPAQPPPPTARNARPSCSSTTAAGLSTAAGGRRIRRTNDRRRGQVVFTATTSRQAAQRPTAAYSVTKIPAGDGSASVSETRVNFRERQRAAVVFMVLAVFMVMDRPWRHGVGTNSRVDRPSGRRVDRRYAVPPACRWSTRLPTESTVTSWVNAQATPSGSRA